MNISFNQKPTNGRIAGILFDKDGVLVDFYATWEPATAMAIRHVAKDDDQARALAEAVDFDLDAERFAPTSVFIAGTASDSMDAWASVPGADLSIAEQISDHILKGGVECVIAPSEVPVALHALKATGLPLGIATNDEESSARGQMAKLGLTDLFETINGADSGHGAKPGPGMILAFAAHLGVEPSRIVMVGDSTHDMHAAHAAGAIRVAIGTGPASLESLAPHADHTIETMADLPGLIAALNQTA